MADQPDFNWIPAYKELATRVLEFEHRQGDLLSILHGLQADGLPVISLMDKGAGDEQVPLQEIDPFTFFASFNRQSTDTHRLQILTRLKSELDLQLPTPRSIEGIPVASALASWFFPFKKDRKADDIPALWELAKSSIRGGIDQIDPKVFDRCLQIYKVGLPKLTVGLFWLLPDEALPFDKNTRAYLASKGIHLRENNYASYMELLHETRGLGKSPAEISLIAPKHKNDPPTKMKIPEEAIRQIEELMTAAYPDWASFRDPRFEEQEIDYKQAAIELARQELSKGALEHHLANADGDQQIITKLRSVAQATNLLYLTQPSKGDIALLYETAKEFQGELCREVFSLLHGEGDSPDRLDRFVAWQTNRGLKPKWTFPTYYLFLLRPDQDIFVKPAATKKVISHLGLELDLSPPPTGAAYRRLLAISKGLIQSLEDRGARDMLDIQSMIWVCNQQLKKGGKGTTGGTTIGNGKKTRIEPKVFDGLLKRLEEKGLYFSVELVSNYLLALQSKRFVLLTGISGTGKTQLALEVADYLRPKVKVQSPKQTPEDSHPITVQPYMLKHNHIVLPVAFVAEARFPATSPGSNSIDIEARCPTGSTHLRLWRDPSRNVTTLYLKGETREWFRSSVEEGDTVFLSSSQDVERPQIQLSLAELDEREELLDNCFLEAVRPDWTDNRGLLGYFNPLTGRYLSTPFLDLLLRASREADEATKENRAARPFFAILDEMNLARVEHYFSDFLSAMESEEPIHLHDDPAVEGGDTPDGQAIPREVSIPHNLFFVGTVNIDESTYMFSPKVLDRAFTLELNEVDLHRYSGQQLQDDGTFRASKFPSELLFGRRPGRDDWDQFGGLLHGQLRDRVISLNQVLATENRHFGYRVANEIARFVALASQQVSQEEVTLWKALDLALLAKALPKLHGTQQELEPVLDLLFVFAVRGKASDREDECLKWNWTLQHQTLAGEIPPTADGVPSQEAKVQFPLMARKLYRMRRKLRLQGFTSFIE